MPASAAPHPILTEFKGGIARLIFNNPARHNAMSLEMWTHGAELLEAFGRDDNIRAILLTGAGNQAFVAGADISKFGDERASREAVETYDRAVARFQQVMRDLEKPTIARIDGFCIGGGLAIAIECDIRVCSEKSSFSVPAAKLGIGYAMDGIRRLRTLTGPAFAAEIFYTARLRKRPAGHPDSETRADRAGKAGRHTGLRLLRCAGAEMHGERGLRRRANGVHGETEAGV